MPLDNHLNFLGCLFIGLLSLQPLYGSLYMEDFLFTEKPVRADRALVTELFNRTLLPRCDFTVNVCDINCCQDQDCQDVNLDAYECTAEEFYSQDPIFTDSRSCYSNSTEFIDPVLCYELENTPYLGNYFPEEKVIQKKGELLLEKASTANHKYNFNLRLNVFDLHKPVLFAPYKFGSRVIHANDGDAVNFPRTILDKGCCKYDSEINFLVNTKAVCSSVINADKCENSEKLSLNYYFEEDEFGRLFLPSIFSGNFDSEVKVNVTVLCLSEINRSIECENILDVKKPKFDKFQNWCKNVVTQIDYIFTWRGNNVEFVNLTVTLSDVPLNKRRSTVPSAKNSDPVVAQLFNVAFIGNSNRRSIYRGDYGSFDRIVLHHVS